MRKIAVMLAAAAAAAALSSCGSGPTPEDTLTELRAAVDAEQWEIACDLMTPDYQENLGGQFNGRGCAASLSDGMDGSWFACPLIRMGEIGESSTNDSTATLGMDKNGDGKADGDIEFYLTDDKWLISDLVGESRLLPDHDRVRC